MKKLLILVEGQTEEQFVKRLLNPHLIKFNSYAEPKIVTTKKIRTGPDFKGGIKSYDKVKNEINLLLRDSSSKAVSTMIDYYHLPNDFPGKSSLPEGTCFEKVSFLEKEFGTDINNPKFIPYLQLHEFEALIMCCSGVFRKVFPRSRRISQLDNIINNFDSPEEVNEGQMTSPSKRILGILPEYRKTLHGIQIAIRLEVEKIRSKCRHFRIMSRF